MNETHNLPNAADDALAMLRAMMNDDEITDSARVAAAKALLERAAPEEDEEARQRETEERSAALAEARGLLAEFAAAKLAGFHEPAALGTKRKARTAHAARRK